MDSRKAELYARDVSGLPFVKSQRSHDDDPPDNCVETYTFEDGVVALRDSHSPSQVLFFTPAEWDAFGQAMRGEVPFV
ncbi:MAG TPA: DUF397 domain-containing protein [Pseudonocardiaceae bacterium]|jgi:hypothetical protein